MDNDAENQIVGPAMLALLTDRTFVDILLSRGPTSRADIAKATGISRPTISESAQRLIASGHIVEVGLAEGKRGRAAMLYGLNPHRGFTFAASIERGTVIACTQDYAGNLLWRNDIAVAGGDIDDYLAATRDLIDQARTLQTPMLAAAISVAAPVDPTAKTVDTLAGAPIAGHTPPLPDVLGLNDIPVDVDNDVNWASMAEHRVGPISELDHFLYVHVGAGIGAGLFLSGKPFRGTHGTAGEVGFLRMPDGSNLMGRLGESPIGTDDGHSIDVDKAHEVLIDIDNPITESIITDLTRVLVNATTVLDPGCLILGGPLTDITVFVDALIARVNEFAFSPLDIRLSSVEGSAPLAGALAGARDLEHARTFPAPTSH